MAITINGSGTVTGITAGGLPDAIITQPELATGVAGTGPAFSAYLGSNQSLTASTFTKVTMNTEEFDTASCFNNTGSTVGGIPAYAFLPNVAGYYQVNGLVYPATAVTAITCAIYKNGASFKAGWGTSTSGVVSALIYLNGSTDYIECYSYLTGVTPSLSGSSSLTFFQASFVRAA
jgi:hypothetical protein